MKFKIQIKLEQLEEGSSFRYFGAIIPADVRFQEETRASIGLATAGMTRHKLIWNTNNMPTTTKIQLYRSIVQIMLRLGLSSLCFPDWGRRRLHDSAAPRPTLLHRCLTGARYPSHPAPIPPFWCVYRRNTTFFKAESSFPPPCLFVSGLVERLPAPRRGFRGECCPPTALRRLCR